MQVAITGFVVLIELHAEMSGSVCVCVSVATSMVSLCSGLTKLKITSHQLFFVAKQHRNGRIEGQCNFIVCL